MLIEQLRKTIDELDYQMAILFKKRMETVKEIIDYKRKNNIMIFDIKREQEMKEKNRSYVSGEFAEYYLRYLDSVISISREYQKNNYE